MGKRWITAQILIVIAVTCFLIVGIYRSYKTLQNEEREPEIINIPEKYSITLNLLQDDGIQFVNKWLMYKDQYGFYSTFASPVAIRIGRNFNRDKTLLLLKENEFIAEKAAELRRQGYKFR